MAKICIDPGHGGSDPGACANGLRECDIALSVSMMVGKYLQAAGLEVVMTRETDKDVGYANDSASEELQARCDISNNAGADVFVSIHCNSVGNAEALGTETFYCAGSTNGRRLAECIHNRLVGLDLVDRGVKDNPLYVTGHTDAVAALTELAFISNTGDAARLGDASGQDQFARAVACGVTDYLQGV